MKCLVENCEREEKTRGLCKACYTQASKEIREGRIHSWEYLESLGMVNKKRSKRRPSATVFAIMLRKKQP